MVIGKTVDKHDRYYVVNRIAEYLRVILLHNLDTS
jgi:hypothetical protein